MRVIRSKNQAIFVMLNLFGYIKKNRLIDSFVCESANKIRKSFLAIISKYTVFFFFLFLERENANSHSQLHILQNYQYNKAQTTQLSELFQCNAGRADLYTF